MERLWLLYSIRKRNRRRRIRGRMQSVDIFKGLKLYENGVWFNALSVCN